jgi:hypothetical protein
MDLRLGYFNQSARVPLHPIQPSWLASLSLRIPAVASVPGVSNRFCCCWFCAVAGVLAVAGIPAAPDASPLLLLASLLYKGFPVTFMLLLAFPSLLTFLPLIVSLLLLAYLLVFLLLQFASSKN